MKFIKIVLLAIIIILVAVPIADAVTDKQRDKVFKEVTTLCNIYRKSCTIEIVDNKYLIARTQAFGKIIVSTGMIKAMNEDQFRSVLFHEVGHRVLEHVEKTSQYLYFCQHNKNCDSNYITEMRRRNEYEADKFSVLVLKFTRHKEALSDALLIITPAEDVYKTFPTHPSTADRIRQIDRIMGR